MSPATDGDVQLEIGHVLFIDIVSYSKLVIDEQRRVQSKLTEIVRQTEQFRSSDQNGNLVRLPTGDGMALVFRDNMEAPVRCAAEIAKVLRTQPELRVRMGVHSGPVSNVIDVNERLNVAGDGINIAQRIMDCGDAGHILLSKRVAEDLAHYGRWRPQLHDLGDVEVKHGVKVDVFNLCGDDIGNPNVPEKIAQKRLRLEALARRSKIRRLLFLAASVAVAGLAIALSIFAYRASKKLHETARQTSLIMEKSIAVLPFENFEADKESTYFADGVQDDILTDLAKVADLKVISRRSVAQYRGSTQRIRDIGQALQVGYVLEGTVRRIGQKIRMTAQLIETRTETEKWAEKYERDLADLFAIQNQISETIVAQLKAVMSPAEKSAIETAPTRDMQAYDLYLRARAIVYAFGVPPKVRDENRPKARKMLEDAIARDPKFVLAYCLLSEVQSTPNWAEQLTPEEIARAKATAETAVQLAPESGEAHLALGNLYYSVLQDHSRGVEEFTVAARSMPNSVDVLSTLGQVAVNRGNWREALQRLQKAAQVDPRDPDVAVALIQFYAAVRRYDDAELLLDRTISILPPQSGRELWAAKSEIAIARGDLKAAMAALEASPNHATGSPSHNHRIAKILLLQRRYSEAEELIHEIPDRAKKGNVLPRSGLNPFAQGMYSSTLGIAYRAEGNRDKAQAAFEASRSGFLTWLQTRPDEPQALGRLAMADAGLGRKEEALHEAAKAMDVWPMSREPLEAIGVRELVAVVRAWTGDQEGAIRLLQEISKLPGSPAAGDLKFNPKWDEMRSDPRFAAIIAEAAKPVRID